MGSIQLSNDLVPLAEFKTHISSILEKIKSTHQPVVITKNGRAAGVVVSPEDYDKWIENERFISELKAGLKDSEKGKVLSDDEFKMKLESEFGSMQTM